MLKLLQLAILAVLWGGFSVFIDKNVGDSSGRDTLQAMLFLVACGWVGLILFG